MGTVIVDAAIAAITAAAPGFPVIVRVCPANGTSAVIVSTRAAYSIDALASVTVRVSGAWRRFRERQVLNMIDMFVTSDVSKSGTEVRAGQLVNRPSMFITPDVLNNGTDARA